jgi:hypothetical protein
LAEAPAPESLFVPAMVAAPMSEPAARRLPKQRKRRVARDAGVIELEIDGVAGRPWRRCQDGGGGDPRAEGCNAIGPTGAVKVMVATKPVDFRNYVERRIMRSPGRLRRAYCRYVNKLRLANQALQPA